ncbi:MAG TPA: hypothetical protein VK123_00660 [Candidatus Limnocylindrales bacterium]|nr:hypothetical protein [Candidatus Limnocylindrales bacterium]
MQLEATFERQTSPDGREKAAPLALEYGITDRLELLLEPVFFTSISPRAGRRATGIGDLEVTLTQVVRPETAGFPALAAALEVKVPTSHDPLIGTGKADATGYLVASKRLGSIDAHLNAGYTVLGRPSGIPLHNVFDYAAAAEWHWLPKFDLVAEMIGNTSALPEGGTEADTGGNPEISGAETVGMLGLRYHWSAGLTLAMGVSYDNNQAWLLRPGVTFKF